MFLPPIFREDRLDVQLDLIRTHPFGLMVINGPKRLDANPLPFLIYPEEGAHGTLRAHFSRGNPLLQELASVHECLVVFQGPQKYITPSWYPTKQESGKVVPTWNYATVHAWGRPRVIDDPAWLRPHLADMTQSQESARLNPWKVDDAPDEYIVEQMQRVVGLEIPINHIEGKWKVSQNRSRADRRGVVTGLLAEGDSGKPMAALVAQSANISLPSK